MQTRLFIGGDFVGALEGGTIEVRNPHDGSLLAEVAEARAADVDLAVAPPGRLPGVGGTTAAASGVGCCPAGRRHRDHADELARLESTDTGHPLKDTRSSTCGTAATYRYFGGLADKFEARSSRSTPAS